MNIETLEYKGLKVKVNLNALNSFKVQKAIAQMETQVAKGFDALDKVFCNELDDIIDKIPDEDGKPYPYGAPADVVSDLITHVIGSIGDEASKKA